MDVNLHTDLIRKLQLVTNVRKSLGHCHVRTPSSAVGINSRPNFGKGSAASGLGISIKCGIFAILFVAPLALGGRDDLGRFVYLLSVTLFAAAFLNQWSVDNYNVWIPGILFPLFIAGAILPGLQLIPFHENFLNTLAPGRIMLLPIWGEGLANGPLRAGVWDILSFNPHATRRAVFVILAHITLFLVILQVVRNVGDVERLLRWIALAVTFMAVFGLGQYFSRTEKFAFIFAHPSRVANQSVSGPFSNPNHFAHFLMLGIGPLLWWLQDGLRQGNQRNGSRGRLGLPDTNWHLNKLLYLSLCIAVVGLAGALTMSRGGVLVMGLACIFAIVGFWRMGRLSSKIVFGLGTAVALLSCTLLFHGVEKISDELGSLAATSIDELDPTKGRRRVWAANFSAWRDFPILGTGVGSHAQVYPIYFSHPSTVEYTHAESSLLQVLSETGIVGFSLLVLGIIVCFYWCLVAIGRSATPSIRACGIATFAGIVASVIHAMFDFAWHLTACMSLTVILAACACRLYYVVSMPASKCRWPCEWIGRHRIVVVVVTIIIFVVGLTVCGGAANTAWHWCDYKRLSLQMERDAIYREHMVSQGEITSEEIKSIEKGERVELMARLHRVLESDPVHPLANLRMTAVLLKEFEMRQQDSNNAMTLSDIRSASLMSRFTSKDHQDKWLNAAVGENRQLLDKALVHLGCGLQGAPLQGRGYAFWADLAFLQGWREEGQSQLINQALAVRSFDAAVLFAAGQFFAQLGNPDLTIEYWKQAFHQAVDYRDAIIKNFASHISAEQFVELFEPNQDGLQRLFREYRRLKLPEDAKAILPLIVAEIERQAGCASGTRSANLWKQAQHMYTFVGNEAGAISCLQRAIRNLPNDFELHKLLSLQLITAKRYEESVPELVWCLRRQPNDEQLGRYLRLAQTRRFESR